MMSLGKDFQRALYALAMTILSFWCVPADAQVAEATAHRALVLLTASALDSSAAPSPAASTSRSHPIIGSEQSPFVASSTAFVCTTLQSYREPGDSLSQ